MPHKLASIVPVKQDEFRRLCMKYGNCHLLLLRKNRGQSLAFNENQTLVVYPCGLKI